MHVCSICEELIEQIIRPKIKSSSPERGYINIQPVNFGWLDSIIENSHECNLCRLVAQIWDRTSLPEHASRSTPSIVPNGDDSNRVYVCLDNSTPTPLAEDGIRLHWMIGIDFFYPGRNGQSSQPVATQWEPKFALLADDFDKVPLTKRQELSLLGRIRKPGLRFDAEFLKSWFQTCLNEHGQVCDNPVRKCNGRTFPLETKDELPLRMRCIDVVGQNIVHIPRDGSCRYAVLSYVWGASNFLRLTKATYAQLTAREGLTRIQIPRTISDAIDVTKALGLQYLWVDSLCIIQDYESEKTQQIAKMNKIYASAVLTIVAASATEADGGLWDIIEGSRLTQVVEEIGGFRFIGTEPTLEDVLRHSIWKTRAWTYQEYVLSKRMLVFSGTQAYFSCEQGACAEDYTHSIDEDGNQRLEYVSSDNDIGISVDRLLNFPVFWPTLIREYTQRQLSFEADALNAAAGVMASYGLGSGASFVCGLPLKGLFEYSLLWYPSRTLKRRSSLGDSQSFPTWSWAGWVGPISYEETDDTQDFASGKIIHEWSLETAQKVLVCDKGNLKLRYPGSSQHFDAYPTTGQMLEQKSDIDRHLRSMEAGVLSFQTQHGTFKIAGSVSNQFVMSDDSSCEFTGLYKIFHRDVWIGSIHLEHRVAQDLTQEDENLCHFIALSLCNNGSWYVPERSNPHELDPEPEWVPLFDPAHLEEDDGDDTYNVMLVKYGGSHTIMERVGIGQIHKKSFDAQATFKDILLG